MTNELNIQRLCELAGVEYVLSPTADRAKQPAQLHSWDTGRDDYDPDVADIQDPHRRQTVDALNKAVSDLTELETLFSIKDVTDPSLNNIKVQVENLKLNIREVLNTMSFPPKDAPIDPQTSTHKDPSQHGDAQVG